MGNIICGLSSNEILSINLTSFKAALTTFSNLNFGCTAQDFADLLTLAKSAYSDQSFIKYRLEESGLLFAGFSIQDLYYVIQSNPSPSLIDSIDPQSFELMDFNFIQGLFFGNEIVKYLNRNQLSAIKSNPIYDSLDASLKNDIEYGISGDYLKEYIGMQTTNAPTTKTSPTTSLTNPGLAFVSNCPASKMNLIVFSVSVFITLVLNFSSIL